MAAADKMILEKDSPISETGQTTVPKVVRDALGLSLRDRIRYRIENGNVSLHAARDEPEDDPVIGHFLAFLARDMERRPGAIVPMSRELASHVSELVKGIAFDPEETIEGESCL